MYSIRKSQKRVIGTDSEGKTRILFDAADVYRNKGQIPLRTIDKEPDGSVKVIEILTDAVFERYEKYKDSLGNENETVGYLAADFLLSDYLITRPEPVKTVLIDLHEKEREVFHNIVGYFNADNLILDISSSMRNEIFMKHGFDIVLIGADDIRSKEQLRTAFYFLSENGILLVLSKGMSVFNHMAELFLDGLEKIRIDEGFLLIRAEGCGSFRDWVKPVDIEAEYERLHGEAERLMSSEQRKDDQYIRKHRSLIISINRLVKESQKQWNLEKKQALIDLKEKMQTFLVSE